MIKDAKAAAVKNQLNTDNEKHLEESYTRAAKEICDFVSSTGYEFVANKDEIDMQYKKFSSRFSPEALLKIPDEDLLQSLFYTAESTNDCMCYWLEFHAEIREYFGSISGGSSYKFGLFQRQIDKAWITGSPTKPEVLSEEDALNLGKEIRSCIIQGAEIIASFGELNKVEDYEELDNRLNEAIGKYANLAWFHKYYQMIFPTKFATFHSNSWQKHILYAYGIKPSVKYYGRSGQLSIIANQAEMFASFFSHASRERFGTIKQFCRIGTTGGDDNSFAAWKKDSFAAVGWGGIGPLSDFLQNGKITKNKVAEKLQEIYFKTNKSTATRKAGELVSFYNTTEDTVFVAMEGETLLALGDEVGGYFYNADTEFAHCKPVKWHNCFQIGEKLENKKEGLMTTSVSLIDSENLLYLYHKYYYELDDIKVLNGDDEGEVIEITRKPRTDCIHPLNQIIYGPPGTGKTYSTAEYALAIIENRIFDHKQKTNKERKILMDCYRTYVQNGQITFTTFHQSYGYEEFIQGIRPDSEAGTICFKKVDGIFKRIADKAMNDAGNNYVIIIDEINRGNISKVFGELITLIEEDKRCGELNELSVTLPLGDTFAIPNNLYVIGTMNSADKSISLIDTALRRRFSFVEMAPDETIVENTVLRNVLIEINTYLKKELRSNDLLIGHAFFTGKKEEKLGDIMNCNIIPLLYEYFYDDEAKVNKALDCLIGTSYELDSQYNGRIRIQKKV